MENICPFFIIGSYGDRSSYGQPGKQVASPAGSYSSSGHSKYDQYNRSNSASAFTNTAGSWPGAAPHVKHAPMSNVHQVAQHQQVHPDMDQRNYKLMSDPNIKKGVMKIYRYDGVAPGVSSWCYSFIYSFKTQLSKFLSS